MVACLYLDDNLTKRQMERFAEAYKRKVPSVVRLGHPIQAIHYIEAGQGWPLDQHGDPRSILNCHPDDAWAGMASRPPVVAQHPLLNQPADTLSFQCRMSAGMPAVIHYDSIAEVAQLHEVVEITLHHFGNAESIGLAIVGLEDETAAAELAESLRLRRVKRISSNQKVYFVHLYPNPDLCRGKEPRGIDAWDLGAESGHENLWRMVRKAHPDDFARPWRDGGANPATIDEPGVERAAWTLPALPAISPLTVPALQALTVNA